MFRLDKRKIFLLYQYYLLGSILKIEQSGDRKTQERVIWFNNCLAKESYLREEVEKKLKTGWEFFRLPPLERGILIFTIYELFLEKNSLCEKIIIDQIVNFSKTYLEKNKYKYINKILDLIIKEKSLKKIN